MTKLATSMTPSEVALIELWDVIDATRLNQSEQHAAILARRALAAAVKEYRLNAKLKALGIRANMPFEKLDALVKILGEDGAEEVMLRAEATEKSASDLQYAYKAEAADDELTLSSADLAAIGKLVAEAVRAAQSPVVAETKRAPTSYPPISENSLLGQATKKAYDAKKDLYARAMGADQTK